jgi:4-amino-4-deoxy-L-arabinose transferase-like glycosyltransferase
MDENNLLEKGEKKIEGVLEVRKNKLKHFFLGWVKDNYDKIFLSILFVAFIIRIWIFFRTMNQPLWWDEADYLSAAKRWGLSLNIRDIWYYRRGFLFPLASSLFYMVGLGEFGIRLLEILFSVGFILVSYLFIAKIFDKKLALLSCIGLTFSWILLFFGGRVLTDVPAAFFILLSFLLFWNGYVLKKGDKYMYLGLAVFALAVLVRMQSLMMAPAFLAIVFPKEKFAMFKNKKLWIAFSIFLVIFIPQVIMYYNHYGNPISDIASHYLGLGQKATGTGDQRVISFAILNYIFDLPYVLTNWMFYLFLIGAVYFFIDLFFGFDKIFKNDELQKKFFVLFFLLCLFLVMGYVGSPSYVEQRYLSVGLPFLFLIAVYPLVKLEGILEKIFKTSKTSSSIIIMAVLLLLLIPNFNLGNGMIDDKKTSFLEVEQAGMWIKENSNQSDIVISDSLPQTTYYSERSTYPFDPGFKNKEFEKYSPDLAGFEKFVKDYKPRFMILSIFASSPSWAMDFPQKNPNLLIPVKVYKQGDKPVLIVYEFDYKNFNPSHA